MLQRAGRIGFALLARPDQPAHERIRKIAEGSMKYVQKREGIELFCLDEPVMTLDDAVRAASLFKRSEVDAVIIQHGAATPAYLSTELARDLSLPLALWGIPEPLSESGPITCGGMTGLISHGAALTAMGRRFTFVYGLADSEEARRELDRFLRTVLVRGALRRARIVLIGQKSPACLASCPDEVAIKDLFGIEVRHVGLSEVIRHINELSEDEIEADVTELRSHEYVVELSDPAALRRSCATSLALKRILTEGDFAAAAANCRPRPAKDHKLGMSAACARLADAPMPICPLGDICAALTALIEHAYTGRPTFLGEWVQRDDKTNQVLFCGDGTAPPGLANPKFQPKITDGYRSKDDVAFDFPLKSGGVTVARLQPQCGQYKMLVATGRVVEPPLLARGTHADIRFGAPVQSLLAAILRHGFPHNYAIVYEDIKDEIIELADQLGIEVVSPEPEES